MKHRLLKLVLSGSALLLLAGCSNYTSSMYPLGNSKYKVVALSNDEGDANSGAMEKASDMCKAQGKAVRVVSSTTRYQGINKNDATLINATSSVIGALSNTALPGASRNNDYRSEVTFRCL